MASKFYAVQIGRNPGIYESWDLCKKEVHGFPGAIFKGFQTKKEAEDFIAAKQSVSEMVSLEDMEGIAAFVDGSYLERDEFGSGCVLLLHGEIVEEISEKFHDEELASMRNVAGEIKAAELAMRYAIEHHFEKIVIFHDYEGISRWPLGEWKTNKTGTKAYKQFYDEAKKKIQIEFVKVKGHSGNEYNEMADELAKKALGIR